MINKNTNNSRFSKSCRRMLRIGNYLYRCNLTSGMEKMEKKNSWGGLIKEKGLYLQTKCN